MRYIVFGPEQELSDEEFWKKIEEERERSKQFRDDLEKIVEEARELLKK